MARCGALRFFPRSCRVPLVKNGRVYPLSLHDSILTRTLRKMAHEGLLVRRRGTFDLSTESPLLVDVRRRRRGVVRNCRRWHRHLSRWTTTKASPKTPLTANPGPVASPEPPADAGAGVGRRSARSAAVTAVSSPLAAARHTSGGGRRRLVRCLACGLVALL